MTADVDELVDAFEAAVRRAVSQTDQLAAADRDEPVGPEIAAQLLSAGILDVAVDEAHGGLGLDTSAVGQLCAAAGRALLPASYLHQLLVVAPLLAGADGRTAAATLAALATGGQAAGGGGTTSVNVLRPTARGVEIDQARVWLSRDATVAGIVSPGIAVVLPLIATGLSVEPVQAIDPGQGLHLITGEVSTSEVLAVVDGAEAARLWQRWRFGLCAQAAGCAEEVSRRATTYAKERHQFGRPIGSFQAVSHTLADMYAGVTPAISALARAAARLDADAPPTDDMVAALVHWLPARARTICEQAIQVHGGNGFTWEYGLHLHYRRILAVQAALGGYRHTAVEAAAALLARIRRQRGGCGLIGMTTSIS